MKDLTGFAIKAMKDAGAQKAQCVMSRAAKQELNAEKNEFTLFRTTFNSGISLTALLDGKKASISLNQTDRDSISSAAAEVVDMAKNSQADEANDIAGFEEGPDKFEAGLEDSDKGLMFDRVSELLEKIKTEYPVITIVDGYMSFTSSEALLANTNGVEIACRDGFYTSNFTFGAREGMVASSMNGGGGYLRALDKPLWDCHGMGMLIKQNVEELKAKQLKGKFNGDIIIAPFLVSEIIATYLALYLGDKSLISGTSTLKDSLGEKVASDLLNIVSDPTDPLFVSNPLTYDGYRAKRMNILDKGVLNSFVLSQYGANKTGHKRSPNLGGNACIAPGSEELDSLIAGVEKGLLVGRFSGGNPSENGDFSGVAKNSFYIENGKIAYPVTETMISGNFRTVFDNVTGISKETIFSGMDIQPWVRIASINISGV